MIMLIVGLGAGGAQPAAAVGRTAAPTDTAARHEPRRVVSIAAGNALPVYGVRMGIGIGIVLIVIGAILLFALDVNIPFVTDDTLGIILIVAGVLALVLALVMQAQRGRTRHIQENRYDGPPPAA